MDSLTIVGGGISGCEAAWQVAEKGIPVKLYEMRPFVQTGAHQTEDLAEIVCSNSFGSQSRNRSSGLLIKELEVLNSLLIRVAKSYTVPAGHALAVDRKLFSKKVTEIISSHKNISVIREEVHSIPEGSSIIATGPLTSKPLSNAICQKTGEENLFFYDAISPIIEFESIDMDIAFWGSRYNRGSSKHGDYINCPFDKKRYEDFVFELISAERIRFHGFEQEINTGVRAGRGKFFESCLPIEIMAQRGINTLAFGPLRPVGLYHPHKNTPPYAVAQLRQEDLQGEYFNLVGFQTNLLYNEQKRVFQKIPGLQNAVFSRYGQMHRNTFIHSPQILNKFFQLSNKPNTFFCGQITGVEGYLANIASGLYVGLNSANLMLGKEMLSFPLTTMFGALFNYITTKGDREFQPMKPNFGLLPSLVYTIKSKEERHFAYSDRSLRDLRSYLINHEI